MKIQVLGCCKEYPGFSTTAFLLNNHLLLDAGDMGEVSFKAQISHILISHSHFDHINGLPFLGEIIVGKNQSPIPIIGPAQVLECLHDHIFNNKIWPDLFQLPLDGPVFQFQEISPDKIFSAGEFQITSFPMSHSVPSTGYVICEKDKALLYSADTDSVEELIPIIKRVKEINAILLEISFPKRLKNLAKQTGHLTPDCLEKFLKKTGGNIPLLIFHMKPLYVNEIIEECKQFAPIVKMVQKGEILFI